MGEKKKRSPNYVKKQMIWSMINDIKKKHKQLKIKYLLITNQKTDIDYAKYKNDLYETLIYYINEEELIEAINKN